MITMGLFAIMLNEIAYVERWAKAVDRARAIGVAFDQVLVLDGGSTDGTMERLRALDVPVIVRPFTGNFAEQRNFGLELMATDWVFELDADEIPATPLIAGLRDIAEAAAKTDMDCVGVARFNILDGQLVVGPGYHGFDYQYRLHNKACRWRGAVHEEITGYRARFEQPWIDGHFLVHDKTNARHAERNAYYGTLTP